MPQLFTLYFYAHIILLFAIMFNIGLFTKQNGWKISGLQIQYRWWGITGLVLFFISLAVFIWSTQTLRGDYPPPSFVKTAIQKDSISTQNPENQTINTPKEDSLITQTNPVENLNNSIDQSILLETEFIQDSLYVGFFIHLITFLLTFILCAHSNEMNDEAYITVNEIYIILLSLVSTAIPVLAYYNSLDKVSFETAVFVIIQVITSISIVITAVSETKTVLPNNIAVPNGLGIILIIIIVISVFLSVIIRGYESTLAERDQENYRNQITQLKNEMDLVGEGTNTIQQELDDANQKIDQHRKELIDSVANFQIRNTEFNQAIQDSVVESKKEIEKLLESGLDRQTKATVGAVLENFKAIDNLLQTSKRNDSTTISTIKKLVENIGNQTKVIVDHISNTSQGIQDAIIIDHRDALASIVLSLQDSITNSNQRALEKLNQNNRTLFVRELRLLLQKINSLEFTVDSLRKNYKDINIKLKE